ncbi:hypothetical protein [Escherichia coli]|uniref:hypothetical protein n=1 Tax=Escherichia coli TaxID=562 RepID=UPI00199B0A84|nr:hypothetical protein [Escherichia coli]MED6536420.1 hypothetical protein [Escherichia coli O157]MED6562092.1 hypothetical protein [Escherichia coli O157]MED6826776.1 hypothetical protein [Escherichia coli O157]MED6924519.1 hypothetical protein [Escherichia coli O157]
MLIETATFKRFIDVCRDTCFCYLSSQEQFDAMSDVLGYRRSVLMYFDGPLIEVHDDVYSLQYVSINNAFIFIADSYSIVVEERGKGIPTTHYIDCQRTDCVYSSGLIQTPIPYPSIYINTLHQEIIEYCNSISDTDTQYFPIVLLKGIRT